MRLNPREYLADLPLHRVVEVHLSRACFHHALAADAHRRPEDEEFELLEYVLERLDGRRKVLAVLEYYRDASRLLQAAQRLRAVLDKRNNLVPAGCALEAAHA
jgi:uncharacterized protein (UPF0276 family)